MPTKLKSTGVEFPDGTTQTSVNVPTSAMPAGSIIQVVQAGTQNQFTINSTSFQSTGIQANITPLSNSSKILALLTFSYGQDDVDGAKSIIAIFRDNTEVYQQAIAKDEAVGEQTQTAALNFLDSPSTTNTLTYEARGRSTSSGSDIRINHVGFTSLITLFEVAG